MCVCVCPGWRATEAFGTHWLGGGGGQLCLPLKSCVESWRNNKRLNSVEQCGIELRSADRANPAAAGPVMCPSRMNGADCANFAEIFLL